jgi:hypothetical protein
MLVNNYFNEVVHHINLELIKRLEKVHKTITFCKAPFIAIVNRIAFILTVTVIGQLIFSLAKDLYT